MSEWFVPNKYSPFGEFYEKEFYLTHERTEEEVQGISNLAKTLKLKPRILDIAAGPARIAAPISELGFRNSFVGLDINPEFLKNNKWDGLSRVISDMRRLPFKDQSFDMALIMFTSFGYFEKQEDDRKVLEETYRILAPDSFLLIDLPNYINVFDNFNPTRTQNVDGLGLVTYTTRIENGYLIEERFTDTTQDLGSLRLRMYQPEVITMECERAGFNVELIDNKLEPFNRNSRRLWVKANKHTEQ